MSASSSTNKMETKKMFPLIITMGLPAMFSMLVQALYNIVDSYYVAQYSIDALSAVSLAFPIQNLLMAFSVGTSIGMGSLISRKLGEKDFDTANSAATHGLILNLSTWLVFFVAGLLFSQIFYKMFESNTNIIEMGTEYLTIVTCASFGFFISVYYEKIFQATGNMLLPMVVQLVGAITNIILDPILIFGYFGLPQMGISGAALATVIGQILSAIVAIIMANSKKRKNEVSLKFSNFKLNFNIIRQIYSVGFPTIVMYAIGTVMTISLNAILSSFSVTAYTVLGIYFKVNSFVFMPVFGLSSGLMPIVGYNYGAKNKKRVMSCIKTGTLIAMVINTLGLLAFQVFPTQLLSMFNATAEIYEVGIPAFRILSLTFPVAAIIICSSTFYQALGKGLYSMMNSLLRQLIFIVPAAYFLSKISLTAVWFAFPIAEVAVFVLNAFFFVLVYKKYIKDL